MQKRHARWIAGFAVAGTVVVTGAAAGAVADVRSPRVISPATCAALTADLASTVAEAAKDLTATPPDLAEATILVAQANKLQDAFKSLDCTSVPLPATPPVPTVPVPTVPVPTVSVPTVPVPTVSVPLVPGKPSVPAVVASPSLPPMPGDPPSIPALPSSPNLPALSNAPGLPAASQ